MTSWSFVTTSPPSVRPGAASIGLINSAGLCQNLSLAMVQIMVTVLVTVPVMASVDLEVMVLVPMMAMVDLEAMVIRVATVGLVTMLDMVPDLKLAMESVAIDKVATA